MFRLHTSITLENYFRLFGHRHLHKMDPSSLLQDFQFCRLDSLLLLSTWRKGVRVCKKGKRESWIPSMLCGFMVHI